MYSTLSAISFPRSVGRKEREKRKQAERIIIGTAIIFAYISIKIIRRM